MNLNVRSVNKKNVHVRDQHEGVDKMNLNVRSVNKKNVNVGDEHESVDKKKKWIIVEIGEETFMTCSHKHVNIHIKF